MNQSHNQGKVYFCLMHPSVRQPTAGKCPECDMALLPDGTRVDVLRRMMGNPLVLMAMATMMAIVMTMIRE